MKAAVKEQWIKDLRSGEFEQGQKKLDYIDPADGKRKLCCLGVLCRQAVKAGIIPEPELHDDGTYRYLDGRGNRPESFIQDTLLPVNVMTWAGVDVDDVEVGVVHASTMNDLYQYSFAQIADEVEQNVPGE
jgi:hypothetical protein